MLRQMDVAPLASLLPLFAIQPIHRFAYIYTQNTAQLNPHTSRMTRGVYIYTYTYLVMYISLYLSALLVHRASVLPLHFNASTKHLAFEFLFNAILFRFIWIHYVCIYIHTLGATRTLLELSSHSSCSRVNFIYFCHHN